MRGRNKRCPALQKYVEYCKAAGCAPDKALAALLSFLALYLKPGKRAATGPERWLRDAAAFGSVPLLAFAFGRLSRRIA